MIVADTHALVWHRTDNPRLGPQAAQVMDDALADRQLAVSAMTFWEIGLLVRRGRLSLPRELWAWREELRDRGLVEIAIDVPTALRAALLTGLRNDPCDRLIVATAMDGHRLLTADEEILAWGGGLDRIDARR